MNLERFLLPGPVAELYTGTRFKAKLFITKCYRNETAKEKNTDLYCRRV